MRNQVTLTTADDSAEDIAELLRRRTYVRLLKYLAAKKRWAERVAVLQQQVTDLRLLQTLRRNGDGPLSKRRLVAQSGVHWRTAELALAKRLEPGGLVERDGRRFQLVRMPTWAPRVRRSQLPPQETPDVIVVDHAAIAEMKSPLLEHVPAFVIVPASMRRTRWRGYRTVPFERGFGQLRYAFGRGLGNRKLRGGNVLLALLKMRGMGRVARDYGMSQGWRNERWLRRRIHEEGLYPQVRYWGLRRHLGMRSPRGAYGKRSKSAREP